MLKCKTPRYGHYIDFVQMGATEYIGGIVKPCIPQDDCKVSAATCVQTSAEYTMVDEWGHLTAEEFLPGVFETPAFSKFLACVEPNAGFMVDHRAVVMNCRDPAPTASDPDRMLEPIGQGSCQDNMIRSIAPGVTLDECKVNCINEPTCTFIAFDDGQQCGLFFGKLSDCIPLDTSASWATHQTYAVGAFETGQADCTAYEMFPDSTSQGDYVCIDAQSRVTACASTSVTGMHVDGKGVVRPCKSQNSESLHDDRGCMTHHAECFPTDSIYTGQ